VSVRSLGFGAVTLDKLESIPGYRTDLSIDEFVKQVKNVGTVLNGQTVDLAPALGEIINNRQSDLDYAHDEILKAHGFIKDPVSPLL
jgi:thymidine phosphorylase